MKGTGKFKKCAFCQKDFLSGNARFGFRRKYCSPKCIKKRWERDNEAHLKQKALAWRRKNGMLPAGKSSAEEFIYKKLLKVYKPEQIIRRTRKVLKREKYGLELDFYIPSRKLAFEVDGTTHRIACYGKERLEYQKKNDAIKDSMCKEMGITLVRIPFGWDVGLRGELATLPIEGLEKIYKENILLKSNA